MMGKRAAWGRLTPKSPLAKLRLIATRSSVISAGEGTGDRFGMEKSLCAARMHDDSAWPKKEETSRRKSCLGRKQRRRDFCRFVSCGLRNRKST